MLDAPPALVAARASPAKHRRLAAVLLTLLACTTADDSGGAHRLERLTAGDTIVLRNHGGGRWSDSLVLVEEQRVGDAAGSDEYGFGGVGPMVVAQDGTITVSDYTMRVVRQYDSTGRFLRVVGGRGDGPGEYRSVDGLALLTDGRIVLRDRDRVVLYSAAGDPVGLLRLPSTLSGGGPGFFAADTAGRLYAKIIAGHVPAPGGTRWRMGHLRMDTAGRVLDTIPSVDWPVPSELGPYLPGGGTVPHPFGGYVTAYSASYAIHVQIDGSSPVRVERVGLSPVSVPAGEREELEAGRRSGRRTESPVGAMPDIPAVKPAFRGVQVDGDGRLLGMGVAAVAATHAVARHHRASWPPAIAVVRTSRLGSLRQRRSLPWPHPSAGRRRRARHAR